LQGMSKLGAAFGVTAPAGCSAKNKRSPCVLGWCCAPSNLLPFGFQNPSCPVYLRRHDEGNANVATCRTRRPCRRCRVKGR